MKPKQELELLMEAPKAVTTQVELQQTKTYIGQAGGIEKWARLTRNVYWLRKSIIGRRVGQREAGKYLLALIERGHRWTGRPAKGQKIGTPPPPEFKTLEQLDVTKKESFEWQKEAKKKEPEFNRDTRLEVDKAVATVTRDRGKLKAVKEEISRLKKTAHDVREERKAAEIRDLYPGSRRFGVVVLNPPWERAGWTSKKGNERLTVEDLDQKMIDEIAPAIGERVAADDCVLGLWCSEPWRGEKLLRACGFEPKAWFVWVKDVVPDNKKYGPKTMLKVEPTPDTLTVTGVAGTGYWNRDRAEIMLIGVRGKMPASKQGEQGERTWFARRPGKKGENHHKGEKPDIAAEWFEQQYPTMPKVELYAYKYRKANGWASWGPDLPDGPWGIDDAANEALRMPEILSKGDKTPFDDAAE